jgi:uncharacterized protein
VLEISGLTARRYVMGRQGLWPGRRWQGLDGTRAAMRAMEDLQLDPLVVVARAHDLMLHSRVVDYAIDDWALLTYGRREFFEWGGWLAVRPMDELPAFRVVMRRERNNGHWREVEAEHAETVQEMLDVLRERGEVTNRDFAMHERKRVDDYRGRKDSALVLHYLWRVGEVMVTRRERFERVYALTETVAPPEALVDIDEEAADELLLRKQIAASGLGRLSGVVKYLLRRDIDAAELKERQARWLEDGDMIEVKVEGWRQTQLALGPDRSIIESLEGGQIPREWGAIDTTTEDETSFLSPLDPVSARGRAKPLFGFEYTWDVYKPEAQRRFGYYTLPILWGDALVGRFDPRLDRATGTLVVNGLWLEDDSLARDAAFVEALGRGMARLRRFLGATRTDVTAVRHPSIRRRLATKGRGRKAY